MSRSLKCGDENRANRLVHNENVINIDKKIFERIFGLCRRKIITDRKLSDQRTRARRRKKAAHAHPWSLIYCIKYQKSNCKLLNMSLKGCLETF